MYDVIILGSGPAGYTAALYTSRAFLKTLILTGTQAGGQLTTTTEVDNFPGFPKGIMGPQLVEDMKLQVERFGTEVKLESAVSLHTSDIRPNQKIFTIKTESTEYQSKSVIIATGASALYLGLESEKRLMGKGVSACATCDGFFFKGKEVVVVGGGDTAMEEANFLTTFCPKVTIIHRRDEFRASPIMLDRAKKNPKITFLTNKTVEEVSGETSVTGLKLKDVKTGEVSEFPTQGLFLAIGHVPNTKFLNGFIDLDKKGYVMTFDRLAQDHLKGNNVLKDDKLENLKNSNPHFTTCTSILGVFAAGDCVDFHYRQAIVAAGQGCMAAMDVQSWLEENGEN